uniref:Integrator complex subunit 10 n=1 Tax=Elaeophora elaphi TaxID=1147741 RepID=A0A0R3RGI1_9BILA
MELSAKEHLDRCLAEEHDYAVGKAHCRLAALYPDFDVLLCDITELRFYLKWNRAMEAVPILERLVKTHPSDEAWTLIHQLFLKASSSENSTEKGMSIDLSAFDMQHCRKIFSVLFTEISNDAFEFIIGGLTKRFDNDDLLKTKLLLFCLRNADENKFSKLLNRAVTFITERASNDKELESGIGKYHVYLAVFVAPALLKLNFTNITVSRALSIVITVLHVGIAWPEHSGTWTDLLRAISENYAAEAQHFSQESFKIGAALFDKCVILYDLGTPVNLSLNMSGCNFLSSIVDKACNLKSEARKIIFPFFIWYAYKQWIANISEGLILSRFTSQNSTGEILAWIPEDNWAMDVDKLLNSNTECLTPSKKTKLKERKEEIATFQTEYLLSSRRELCEAYELCCAAICAYMTSISVDIVAENLYFASFYSNVRQLITESLLFKCKLNELIAYVDDQLGSNDPGMKGVLHFQLACAHCLDRSWPDACENVIHMLNIEKEDDVGSEMPISEVYLSDTYTKNDSNTQPTFVIIKRERLKRIVYDVAYHILFRVYTSTAMDHDNDQLLGGLLVLTQIDFATKGYRCFNRIMRHVEAKGSLRSAGLVKHISNIAILEELSRIQDYCSEYVSIQIAVPQIQRRIGQSTRHSVRGTKDGQKQSIEEQIKKCRNDPYITVSTYFIENKEAILKMLGAKF